MKIKLITLTTLGALSLGSSAFANEPETAGQDQRSGRGGNHRNSLQHATEQLNLTPEQKAKVQPIIDQTNPQIQTIRRDAMQKIKTLVDNAMAQIRPMLTPEQQEKWKKLEDSLEGKHPEPAKEPAKPTTPPQ